MRRHTSEFAVKVFALFGVVCGYGAIVMGTWWLIWKLWTFVLPQVYPTGPDGLVRPGYWLFAGMWTLFALITWVLKRKV